MSASEDWERTRALRQPRRVNDLRRVKNPEKYTKYMMCEECRVYTPWRDGRLLCPECEKKIEQEIKKYEIPCI